MRPFLSDRLFSESSASPKKLFSVLRLHIENEPQLRFLMDQFLHNSTLLDFWKEPSSVGEDAFESSLLIRFSRVAFSHVMVARGPILDDFSARLRERNISTRVMIEDVSELIRRRAREATENETKRRGTEGGNYQKVGKGVRGCQLMAE